MLIKIGGVEKDALLTLHYVLTFRVVGGHSASSHIGLIVLYVEQAGV